MRVMFVLADLPNKGKANVNIAYKIKKNLEKEGYYIYVYGKYFFTQTDDYFLPLDIKSKLLCKYFVTNSYLYKIFYRFFSFLFYRSFKLQTYEMIYTNMIKNIPKLIKMYNIDSVIIFSAPHSLNKIAIKKNLTIPIYLYMLDPYFSHYLNIETSQEKEQEEYQIISKCQKVFTTELIYQDYLKSAVINNFINKIKIVEFPNVNEEKYKRLTFEGEYNILFLGNLYKDIRNPESIFDVFSVMKIPKLKIFFYGQKFGFPDNWCKKIEEKFTFVKFYDTVDEKDIKSKIEAADFLLNIGNTISNQMPSKIIEYINTGKPIINYVFLDNCPTIKYLKKYSLGFNFIKGNTKEIELEKFILNNKDKILSKEIVLRTFPECTCNYITYQILIELENAYNE